MLKYLRRNKRKCVKCGQWIDIRPNMLEPFIGQWCRRCVCRQEAETLKQIGTVLGIRAQERDDFQDIANFADKLIRALPKERGNRTALWIALNTAVDCEIKT